VFYISSDLSCVCAPSNFVNFVNVVSFYDFSACKLKWSDNFRKLIGLHSYAEYGHNLVIWISKSGLEKNSSFGYEISLPHDAKTKGWSLYLSVISFINRLEREQWLCTCVINLCTFLCRLQNNNVKRPSSAYFEELEPRQLIFHIYDLITHALSRKTNFAGQHCKALKDIS